MPDVQSIKKQLHMQQWTAIIEDRIASGLKINEYCEKNQLSRNSYFYWLRKIREEMSTLVLPDHNDLYYYVLNHPLVRKNIERINGKRKESRSYDNLAFENIINNARSMKVSSDGMTAINPVSIMLEQILSSESMDHAERKTSKKLADRTAYVNQIIDGTNSDTHINKNEIKNEIEDLKSLFVNRLDVVNLTLRQKFIKRIELILALSGKDK